MPPAAEVNTARIMVQTLAYLGSDSERLRSYSGLLDQVSVLGLLVSRDSVTYPSLESGRGASGHPIW
jgi:hypothetical protein